MQGDVPFPLYSFETAAAREGRLLALIRPSDAPRLWDGTILNHGGHRFRVLECFRMSHDALTIDQAARAGFAPGDGLDEWGKAHRWLHQIGGPAVIDYYRLEPLERESNTPL